MFSGQNIVDYGIMSSFIVATPVRRRGINNKHTINNLFHLTEPNTLINTIGIQSRKYVFHIFSFVSEAPLHCCVVVVAKLNNCRVPSSAFEECELKLLCILGLVRRGGGGGGGYKVKTESS